jgi:myo-inositol-1(or 4)-monophosphatase
MSDLLDIAVEAARLGASVLNEHFGRIDIQHADAKGISDFVSDVDRESEEVMKEFLLKELPDSVFLGEETGQGGEESTYRWIVDPLDGTTNYLQKFPIYAVSIALERRSPDQQWGEIVVGAVVHPVTGDLWTAVKGKGACKNETPIRVAQKQDLSRALLATGFPFRAKDELGVYLETFQKLFLRCAGIRRAGAAALDLCWTAEGVFDGFWEHRLSAWDIAAGGLIIKEAGGIFTGFQGDDHYLSNGNVIGGNRHIHSQMLRIIQETVGIPAS